MESTNLTVPQWSDFAVYWPVSPAPGGVGSVYGQVRASAKDDSDPLLYVWDSEAATPNASVGANGITVEVPSDDSGQFVFSKALYDVFWIDGDGKRHKIAKGKITVDPSVTQFQVGP